MRILFVPPNNWAMHPNPMRHHFLFKRLAQSHMCRVYVLNFTGLGHCRAVMNPSLVFDKNIQLIEKHFLSVRNPALYYFINSKGTWDALRDALDELGIDVVVNSNVLPSAISSFLSQRMGICSIYDCMDYYPQSASAYFAKTPVKTLAERAVASVMRYVINSSDAVITVSDFHAELVRRINSRKPIYVVPNGVDLEVFNCGPIQRPAGKGEVGSQHVNLVYVGSVDEWLDFESVIEGIHIAKCMGITTHLTIVGGSHGGFYIDRIMSLVRLHELDRELSLAGFVPHNMVVEYIRSADAVLAPYKIVTKNQVTPLKILEYLACGKIVLCTRVTEIQKRFGDFLHFYDGPRDLARLLLLLCSDRASMERKPENAFGTLSEYSWDKLAKRYYDIIRTVVEARS